MRRIAWHLFALLAVTAPARAAEAHYLLVFGSESTPKRLKLCHSWGTFVRADWDDANPSAPPALEAFTVSWVPASLEVKLLQHRGVPGANLDLDQVVRWVSSLNESITAWGPFRIRKELYDRAWCHLQRLLRGEIQYRAIDTRFDPQVSDCIHAMTDAAPEFGRGHFPLIRVGKAASRYIAEQVVLYGAFDQGCCDNAWLIPALGVDRYPVEVIPPGRMAVVQQGRSGSKRRRRFAPPLDV